MDRVDQDIQVSHITVLLLTERCAQKEVCVKLQACLFNTQKGDLVCQQMIACAHATKCLFVMCSDIRYCM